MQSSPNPTLSSAIHCNSLQFAPSSPSPARSSPSPPSPLHPHPPSFPHLLRFSASSAVSRLGIPLIAAPPRLVFAFSAFCAFAAPYLACTFPIPRQSRPLSALPHALNTAADTAAIRRHPSPNMSAVYSIYTSPNHAPIPNHLPTLIVTPYGQPHHTLYSYIHTNYNKETYLLTPSPQGDLCVAKMVPPPGSRGPGGGSSDGGHSNGHSDKTVRCEASRNLKWSITNTGIHAPVYKLTLPNPDAPGHEQPLFQISKPNPNATWWTMFYFTYAGHLIPPKRIEFGKIQKNAAAGSGGGGGTRVTIAGKTPEEKAVWQTLGEGNEDMVEWIVLCAALNVLDDEIIKAAQSTESKRAPAPSASTAVPSSRPAAAGGAMRGPNPQQKMPMPVPQPQGGVNAGYRGPSQAAGMRPAQGAGPQPNPQMYQQQRGPPPPQQQYRAQGPPQPHPQQGYAPPPQQHAPRGPVPASGRRF